MPPPLRDHALIIEDEMLIALEVSCLLADLGFRSTSIADNPTDALRLAKEQPPSLITADYRILNGTGLEAVEAIMSELGPIPIIFITGNAAQVADLGWPVLEKPLAAARLAAACATARSLADQLAAQCPAALSAVGRG